MKKTIIEIIIAIPIISSCTISIDLDCNQTVLKKREHEVTIAEARQTIEYAIRSLYPCTKGDNGKYIVEEYYVNNQALTKSKITTNPIDTVPPYYVFNFNDNRGYAIASADDRMCPILCIVDTGAFYVDSVLTDPGQIAMLSRIETDYKMALGLPITDFYGNTISSAQYNKIPMMALSEGEVSPVGYWTNSTVIDGYQGTQLSTKWGQEGFYNALMYNSAGEKCPTGCVNTAVAQVLNYHANNIYINGYYIDWSEVGTVISRAVPGTTTGRTMLQNYFYQAAINLQADMHPDGTGIDPSRVPGFLTSLGYTSGGTFADYSFADVKQEIINDYPALVGGFCYAIPHYVLGILVYTEYDGGHRWVCDRVMRLKTTHHWVGTPYYPDNYSISYLVHCNFGWDGSHDGYYYTYNFNTSFAPPYYSKGEELPEIDNIINEKSGTAGYYQYHLTMITGIRP